MTRRDSAPAKAYDHGEGLAAARAAVLPAGHCAAVALVGLGRYKAAASAMEKLAAEEVKEHSDLAAGLYGQAAQAWVLANDNSPRVKDENAGSQLAPGNPDLLVDRGVILASTGKFWEAMDDFSKAHDMADRRADILVFRATAYRMLKSFDLAQDDIDRAIELQPKNPDAYLERGIIRASRRHATARRPIGKKRWISAPAPPRPRRRGESEPARSPAPQPPPGATPLR